MTQNKMTVVAVVINGNLYRDVLPTEKDLDPATLTVLQQGEALNSKVFAVPPKPEDAPNAPLRFAGGNQTA